MWHIGRAIVRDGMPWSCVSLNFFSCRSRAARILARRLVAIGDKAIAQVGPEKYRMWIAYLAGVSFAFNDGSLQDLPDHRHQA